MNIYKTLLLYRLYLNETWPRYAMRFDGIRFPTLFRVLNGQNKPNSRTEYKILRFYEANRAEIETALAEYDSIHNQKQERATA